MTTIDGYEMAKKGRAGAALAVSAIGSFIAGTIGVVALTLFAHSARVDGAQVRPGGIFHADALRDDRGVVAHRQVARQGHALDHPRPDDRDDRHRPAERPAALHDGRAGVPGRRRIRRRGRGTVRRRRGVPRHGRHPQGHAARDDQDQGQAVADARGMEALDRPDLARRHHRLRHRRAAGRGRHDRVDPVLHDREAAVEASRGIRHTARSKASRVPRPRTTRTRPARWCRC